MVTLDGWCESTGIQRVDLIKLDVEGAEPFALEGAARTVAVITYVRENGATTDVPSVWLAFGLVQEQFAWLTDLRPELLVTLPVEVV